MNKNSLIKDGWISYYTS